MPREDVGEGEEVGDSVGDKEVLCSRDAKGRLRGNLENVGRSHYVHINLGVMAGCRNSYGQQTR